MHLTYLVCLLKIYAAIKHQKLCHMEMPSWEGVLLALNHLFVLSLGTKALKLTPTANVLTGVAWK